MNAKSTLPYGLLAPASWLSSPKYASTTFLSHCTSLGVPQQMIWP